jgi:uncharacterized repeat protein (TIGR01451 family)
MGAYRHLALFRLTAAVALVVMLGLGGALSAATITINNTDGAGEGFNDPTPAVPVGGNPGLTVGQQRLNVFQHAAGIWGSILDDDVTIIIDAGFNPLTCTATSAVLGSAGSNFIESDFGGEEFPSTWYAVTLANKLAGTDLEVGSSDVTANFNSNLNGSPTCLGGVGWYYGFDNNEGSNIDLLPVVLHEMGHGLNFANFVSETTGANTNGGSPSLTDIYSTYTFDDTLGQTWAQINPTSGNEAAIVASAIRCGKISWSGPHVTAAVNAGALQLGAPILNVATPPVIAGVYQVGAAAFGAPLSSPGVTGTVVQALDPADGAGPTTTDACSPLTNGAAVNGNIAIVDRGTCGFIVKVKNAQNAGAIGVIVADNAAGCPPAGLGGADPTITIPSARVTQPDGNAIKAQLGAGVTATLGVDMSLRAGANSAGRALLAALNPVAPGSSISHFDSSHIPNSLMEPAINSDLNTVANDVDLTFEAFQDIGWFRDDVGVTHTYGGGPVPVGTNYAYTLNVVNNDSGTERSATLTDTLPPGTFVSAVGTNWSCGQAAGVVTCTRVAQAGLDFPTGPAEAVTVTMTAPALPGGGNSVAAVSVPLPLEDYDTSNNSSTQAFTFISPASVSATKTVSGSFTPGTQVTYTVVLSNAGPSPQQDNAGDEFTDVLPAGLTLVSANATSGSATTGGNTVHWNGVIPAGGSVTITIVATINSGTSGQTISNQGTTAFDADGNGLNESTGVTDDPATPGTTATSFVVGVSGVIEIPTLSGFALALLALLLGGYAVLALRRAKLRS